MNFPGVKSEATLKFIDSRLAKKLKESYLCNCQYVKSRVTVTLVRSTHRCIRGGRVLATQISMKIPQWYEGAGLHQYLGIASMRSLYAVIYSLYGAILVCFCCMEINWLFSKFALLLVFNIYVLTPVVLCHFSEMASILYSVSQLIFNHQSIFN